MKLLKTLSMALAAVLVAGAAAAATVHCPGTTSAGRVFTLDTSTASTCLGFGGGNISGNPGGADPDPIFGLMPGLTLIDKSDDGTSGAGPASLSATSGSLTSGLTGAFSFILPAAPAGFTWTNIVIAFKSGFGGITPTWAAFLLPGGVTSGTWTISGAKQGLSHVNLYGELVPAAVPLPAAGLLLAGAIGGLAMARRRRKAA
jgi:hypothetical protein